MKKKLFTFAGALALLAVLVHFSAKPLWAQMRALLVEIVLPSKPFSDVLVISSVNLNGKEITGPIAGTLGVTSLTITNLDSFVQEVQISRAQPINGGPCNNADTFGYPPSFFIPLQPRETIHLNFPTPLVFANPSGPGCISAHPIEPFFEGGIQTLVNGFVN